MRSKNYYKIKIGYKKHTWDKQMVYDVVGLEDGITAAEYELIVGEPYIPKNYEA